MGWMCVCGRENDDDSSECAACRGPRRRERTEEDLERLLDEDMKASTRITTRLS